MWQINFNHPQYAALQGSMDSWIDINPAHQHTLLDDRTGREIIQEHYGDDPNVLNTYLQLNSTILRADYLRYLVLAAEGGIYSDLDTNAVKPIDEWYDDSSKRPVRALVGMEYDQLDNPKLTEGMYLPLQFCQWTLAISAHHPLMISMVNSVTDSLQRLARSRGVSMPDLEPTNEDVLLTTGPVMWSQTVFSYLSLATGTKMTYRNLTGLKEPKLFGDVMILPINAFASGLGHSGSLQTISNETLMWHTFKGAWKTDDRAIQQDQNGGLYMNAGT
ncbi:MAG: hypothetical protein Q9219_003915 [cf. Caloplaca sp. 3 TL-2023]